VGVTPTGEEVLLGFVQTATENRKVCAAFLRELVERGLRVDLGLLVVTDGAKGLHAAVREVFGAGALLQRCQWHKRENVLEYLPDRHRAVFRRKLQAAYEQPTYEAAKRALGKIRAELVLLNASAAASLDEGLEETLTLHRLGVFGELGTSLKTTNALESIHARGEPHHQGGSLAEQRAETAVVGDRLTRPRAAAAAHQELPSASPAP
jgi:transposase-like protein